MTGLVRKLLCDYLIENNCERNTKVVAVAINSLLMKQQDYNFMIFLEVQYCHSHCSEI